jgi:uncharacterized protein (DUF2252 family)
VESDQGRIAKLLPIRYGRMAQSPFGFLRGAAMVMARDLAGLPRAGVLVQACGDCHLKNFGAFTSPEGQILFDINDFDETLPGVDFTVDLKRLVASVAVAARDEGLSDRKAHSLALAAARAYRKFILKIDAASPLEVWSKRMIVARELERIKNAKLREALIAAFMKARDNLAADDNYPSVVTTKDGGVAIKNDKQKIFHVSDGDAAGGVDLDAAFKSYRAALSPERRALVERYCLRDTAFKIVGIGSVGTYCAIGLFTSPDKHMLFLQVKEARASVLAPLAAAVDLRQQGDRVTQGQRAMQAASDIFLGATDDKATARQFYVRQLKNRRLDDIFDEVFEEIGDAVKAQALAALADLCGRTLARAHARTGDPALLAGYMGTSDVFDEALASFALAYAKQTVGDHASLTAALDPRTGVPAKSAAQDPAAGASATEKNGIS